MDELLGALKLRLIRMAALSEIMIADALKLLMERDQSLLQVLAENERQVNLMQVELDEMCLTLIALHQPAAADLRFILGAAKTNAEIERLADEAVNISDKAARLLAGPPLKPFVILPRMAMIASGMVKDSLHAYVNRDTAKARDVLRRDDELDGLKREIRDEVVALVRHDSEAAERGLDIVMVAHNLERIGDHATNIAENTIFVAEGRDVRHHLGQPPEAGLRAAAEAPGPSRDAER